jgi:hypothetical protein
MQHPAIRLAAVACASLCVLCARADAQVSSTTDALCHDWFGPAASLTPLALAETNAVVCEVTLDGRPSGWLFRTDQVPPVCKGKRGEIVLLVAVGSDARIKGLHVLNHKEDAPYFKRLKGGFFDQFLNRRADAETTGVDAVTRATLSSRAIIREVLEGASHVVSLPEVAAKIKSDEQSRLTKTAAMSHNQGSTNEGPL